MTLTALKFQRRREVRLSDMNIEIDQSGKNVRVLVETSPGVWVKHATLHSLIGWVESRYRMAVSYG